MLIVDWLSFFNFNFESTCAINQLLSTEDVAVNRRHVFVGILDYSGKQKPRLNVKEWTLQGKDYGNNITKGTPLGYEYGYSFLFLFLLDLAETKIDNETCVVDEHHYVDEALLSR